MLPLRLIVCLVLLLTVYEVNCLGNILKQFSCFENTRQYQTFPVYFYLTTRNQVHKKLTKKNINSNEVDFDPRRMTVVLIPGLTPSLYQDTSFTLRDEFVNWGDVNVIYVDWEKGCPSPLLYNQAIVNTQYAAIVIKKRLIKTWNGTYKSVEHWGPLHFIGPSLGVHLAGQAAELMKRENNLVVDRITALDPAEPCFDNPNNPLRLKKSHANFVDVIHTDAARTKNSRFGLIYATGHIDFYVNGGSVQPACNRFGRRKRASILDPNFLLLAYHRFLNNGLCHHLQATNLFIESLRQAAKRQCVYWAHPWNMENVWAQKSPRGIGSCDIGRCIELGISATLYRNRPGVYYVPTTAAQPFCNYKRYV